MSEKNIKMARGDLPGQGHTIVGGRPIGKINQGAGIPRGIEVILKKAAVDTIFRENLFKDRFKTVANLGLSLDPLEENILKTIPDEQLALIISQTNVPQEQKKVFLGSSVVAMMAIIAQLTFNPVASNAEQLSESTQKKIRLTEESQNIEEYDNEDNADFLMDVSKGIRPDLPVEGIRPDYPSRINRPPSQQNENEKLRQHLQLSLPPHIKDKIVKCKVKGKSFLEAIEEIRKDTGFTIEVEVSNEIDVTWQIDEEVTNKTFEEALKIICSNENATKHCAHCFIDIVYENNTILIKFFDKEPSDINIRPTIDEKPRFPTSTRGSRPDFPELKPKVDPIDN